MWRGMLNGFLSFALTYHSTSLAWKTFTMSTSSPYRNVPSGSANVKIPASSTLSALLAQANSLNNAERDPELPQIRLGMDEIERMSEAVAGRGKKGKSTRGEG